MRSALLLNQYTKSSRQISRFIPQGNGLPYWFQDNFCNRVFFVLVVERFPLSTIANRFEFWCQSKAANAILLQIRRCCEDLAKILILKASEGCTRSV